MYYPQVLSYVRYTITLLLQTNSVVVFCAADTSESASALFSCQVCIFQVHDSQHILNTKHQNSTIIQDILYRVVHHFLQNPKSVQHLIISHKNAFY